MMTPLTYLRKAPFAYGPDDTNIVAFNEVTSIIGCRDAVEEFIFCGLWPLSEKFCSEVEMKETPLSKVTTVISAQEPGPKFKARITNAMKLLVGNYNIIEHNAC
jgi:hypothetical protein